MQDFLKKLETIYDSCDFDKLRTFVKDHQDYILDNEVLIIKSIEINRYFLVHLDTICGLGNTKFIKLSHDFQNFSGKVIDERDFMNINQNLNEFYEYLKYKNKYLLSVLSF